MEEIIFTNIYHGGILSERSVPTYVGNYVPALRYIVKGHFFILELLHYTKELGYETVGGFYVKDLLNKQFVLITSDQHRLHLIKDLKHEDTYEVFVCHVVDLGGKVKVVNLVGESVDVNLGEEGEVVDLDGDGEAVNLGGEGVDANLGEEGVDDNLRGEGESDFLSSDSNLGDIPSEDGSYIDEELRAFRQERRSKKQREKAIEYEEIPVGEAEILGGDEDYLNSSDCWSDDSDEQLDVDVVRGVDILPGRRSKKVGYDEDCEVLEYEVPHTLLPEPHLQLHNQVNQDLFMVTQPLYQDLLKKRVLVGTGRGLGRKKPNARGTPFVTEIDNSSSQLPPLSGHKRPYSSVSFVVATRGNQRPTSGFGVYSDPTTGAQPDTSSEKILHGPTKLKSASPTNIDIDFKPRGLKWKGKDAISTSQCNK
ncbi:hypothetical protein R3W88_011356 [Solanum pinnatisectum]|uniref:Uncharacterized protein n=1 Tax=Solanum pinnatisectum TaxID=50273 RepID=A0AAV9L774_9SOLN|nr:hypothetical protein R3W88_011356 [Solanum pinnatisectum]